MKKKYNSDSSNNFLTYSTTSDYYNKSDVDSAVTFKTISDISDYIAKEGEVIWDTSNQNMYIGTSNGITHLNTHATTTSTPYVTSSSNLNWTSGTVFVENSSNNIINAFCEYLKEEELSNIITSLIERGAEESNIKNFIEKILEKRHLSESFILQFIDYFNIDTLKMLYASEIKSQSYPNLALLVTVQ